MKPKLPVLAPSSTLLRFLRSQSEGVCFFSPNPSHGAFVFDHAAPRACTPRSKSVLRPPSATTRPLSTTSRKQITLEASFLSCESLWPRGSEAPLSKATKIKSRTRNPVSVGRTDLAYITRRNGSEGWIWRKFGRGAPQKGPPLMPDDLPGFKMVEDSGDSMFNLGRKLSAKAQNEPKLKCTEFDENGNVVLVNEGFRKSELIAKVTPPPTLKAMLTDLTSMVSFPGIFERLIHPYCRTFSFDPLLFLSISCTYDVS